MTVTSVMRARVIVTGVAGGPAYITGYFDPATGTRTQIRDAWAACVIPPAGGIASGQVWATDSDMPIIDCATGQILSSASIASVSTTGTNTAEQLPPTNQILLRWKTGVYVAGRQIQGHTNIPYRFESTSTGGTVTPSDLSYWQTAMNTLFGSATVDFVVWSKKNGIAESVTSGAPWNQFAVLRSRRD